MPRPKCCRRVGAYGIQSGFQPINGCACAAEVVLEQDELEAVRLADLRGLYHEAAASEMGISRATFGRIIASARQKIALALIEERPLRVSAPGPSVSEIDQATRSEHGACPECGTQPDHMHGACCCGGKRRKHGHKCHRSVEEQENRV